MEISADVLGDVDLRSDVSPDQYKSAFRHHPAGVSLITATDGTRQVALTATSVLSVSATPPLLVFSVSELSSSSEVFATADSVVIHLLSAAQLSLAQLGATSGIDRFGDSSLWSLLPTGEPVFHGADLWIRCRIVHRLTAGASMLYVALATTINSEPTTDEERAERVPLVYHDRTWHGLGTGSALSV